VVGVVALLVFAVFSVVPAAAQLAPIGNVENAVGTVVVQRADGRVDQIRGKGSLPLYAGDHCKTEKGSKAFIRLVDGTQVAMNEDTSFRYQQRDERGKGSTRIFKLLFGEMWFKTAGPAQLEVETPVATAAIKGTEFNMKVASDGNSVLTVVDGTVEFGTPFGTCPIVKSTQSFGARGKRCTKPVPVDPAPATAWIADVVVR
jgi:ferric-dicitrate binding protein FerR (iron transport regulator)